MKILIVGCSFSEDINLDNVTSWSYLLRNHLKNENIEIINLSKSGQGNGIISDVVVEYVNTHDVDLVLIQWSAFTRIFKNKRLPKEWYKYKNLEWSEDGNNMDILSKEAIEHSLIKINQTIDCLSSKNIKYKMWFGWQQVYPEQIKEYGLDDLLVKIENDSNFLLFSQTTIYDYELENYGLFSKSNYILTLLKYIGYKKEDYLHPATKWGGMTEYIRMNLNTDKYINKYDMHPSTMAHFTFFNNIIKPLFPINEHTIKII